MLGSQSDTHTHTPVRQVEMSAMRILLLCVAFICLSDLTSGADIPRQPNCKAHVNLDCANRNKPVCASDGQTYASVCSYCVVKRSATSPLYIAQHGAC
ncbi:serine protease inhibitor Kazal-type 1-like isoform X5 [Erpetoichthys calabaricus]|uniref:serine protease inhibitor Kazal-type 1-like isoform X5 n=1 Tax=Erpetoichthys calabaricus TaxID=27687 RepID=UPI002234C58D|nr:serine protease inhibitor Kazal-type 1-like isoform X5 [Erpetoichthys calabaricus]